MKKLTQELFQTYTNKDESIRVDILYNNTHDYFYFELFKNEVQIKNDTKIVNNYEDEFVRFSSFTCDYATFENVKKFNIEFLS